MLIINYQISHLNKIKKRKKERKKNHIVLNFLMGYNPIIKNKIKKPVKDNYNENRWAYARTQYKKQPKQ